MHIVCPLLLKLDSVLPLTPPLQVVDSGKNPTKTAGVLQSLIESITSAYPGSDSYLPAYDGSDRPAPGATSETEAEVNDNANRCPDTPMVLLGYSLG